MNNRPVNKLPSPGSYFRERNLICPALLIQCRQWASGCGHNRFGDPVLLNNIVNAKIAVLMGFHPEAVFFYTLHGLFEP